MTNTEEFYTDDEFPMLFEDPEDFTLAHAVRRAAEEKLRRTLGVFDFRDWGDMDLARDHLRQLESIQVWVEGPRCVRASVRPGARPARDGSGLILSGEYLPGDVLDVDVETIALDEGLVADGAFRPGTGRDARIDQVAEALYELTW